MIDQQLISSPPGTGSGLSRDNVTSFDILKLVDKLEELVESAPQFLGKALWINAEEFFVQTNKIRAFLPQEMKRASQISEDSDLILDQARQEAMQIIAQAGREAEERVNRATEEAGRLISTENVKQQAEQQAAAIIADAKTNAAAIARGADGYALEVLTNLAKSVDQIQGTIRGGCEKLKERSGGPRAL